MTALARAVLWLAPLLAMAGCAPHLPPLGAGPAPFTPDADERALWVRAEREEAALEARVAHYDDPALTAYVVDLAGRLVPPEARRPGVPAVTVVLLRDSALGAFAMPNGRLYVLTGLLAHVGDEAQLATVLAHELAHFTGRHALEAGRAAGTAPSDAVAAPAGGGRPRAARGATAHALAALHLGVAARAAIDGYGRRLEREADTRAVDRLADAGYDTAEAPLACQRLAAVAAAGGPLDTLFWGDPARVAARAASMEAAAGALGVSGGARGTDAAAFAERVRALVRDNALLDVRAGRFALAREQLDRVLAATPDDAAAQLAYGDLFRLGAQRESAPAERAELERQALARYTRAAELEGAPPAVFRELGLLYYGEHDVTRAREAFQQYLARAPDAPDARRIEEYVIELER